MIAVENLEKSYGKKAVLRGVTFRAEPGQITLLVGPNGAGKSTTMRVLTGLVRPDAGRALIGGFEIAREKLCAQNALAYLTQNPSFHPRFTCGQVLDFYARLRGINDLSRCDRALETVGLREAARERTGALSGGMRQRLGLAVLLLPGTPVLLLDEPGLSLDPEWRLRLQTILRDEAHRGKTVLVTTHLIAEWNDVAHRCLLCRRGIIERELDPGNLLSGFGVEAKSDGAVARSVGVV
jgi:ABC-2 type transport system ATP-binding protein